MGQVYLSIYTHISREFGKENGSYYLGFRVKKKAKRFETTISRIQGLMMLGRKMSHQNRQYVNLVHEEPD